MPSASLRRSAQTRRWAAFAAGAVVVLLLALALTPAGQRAGAATACESGTAVFEPANNPGLVRDCDTLLELRDELAGSATLNWSADRQIDFWTGVRLSGSPLRVTTLGIAFRGLSGTIPAELAELDKLERLVLYYNKLTGAIPPELGEIKLVQLFLSNNQLTGCLPTALADVPLNDFPQLGLPLCAGTPTATPTPTATATATATATTTATPTASPTGTATATPAATSTATATTTPTATPAPADLPLRLTVYTSGLRGGEVLLGWTALSGASGWQYRLRGPVWQGVQYRQVGTGLQALTGETWGAWTDVPSSDGSTRSYRLGGLRGGFGYDFEVRPKTKDGPGAAARFTEAVASLAGGDATVYAYPATYLEGGRKYRIHRTAYTFTAPGGMTLVMGLVTFNSDGTYTISLWDAGSGSVVLVDADTGKVVERAVQQPPQGQQAADAATQGTQAASRNVGALFDAIEASIRREPEP